MDLFDEKVIFRLFKEEEIQKEFINRSQKLHLISMSDETTMMENLLDIKGLFQKMLPKMPKKYVMRQVYDHKHCNLVLFDGNEQIIGAICYRPAFERKLLEIVFFAIDFEYHSYGYGSFLFNCFKEICKKQYVKYLEYGDKYMNNNIKITDLKELGYIIDNKNVNYDNKWGNDELYDEKTNLYLLTYADNSAIGFFKKQGFVTKPVSSLWIGCIKDYDGGTLMECKLHKKLNYLMKKELVEKLKENIFENMKKINKYHIIRKWDDRDEINEIYKKDFDNKKIEIIDKNNNNKLISNDYSNENIKRTSKEFLYDFIFFCIYTLRSNSFAWPFLEPVNIKEVPYYLEIISEPIDLSLISKKHKKGKYNTLKLFINDINLMVNNCLTFNNVETQYYKCGEKIREALNNLLIKYKKIIKLWELDFE